MKRFTKFAALIDPDPTKQIRIDYLKLFVENADIILHGGTPNENLLEDEEVYTQKSIDKINSVRKNGVPPIYIFPGSPSQVVPGADYVLYLYIPNSKNTFFSWGIQIQSIEDVLKIYPRDRLKPMMYLPKGGKAGEFADIDDSWTRADFRKAAKIANMLGFHSLYMEGGSGATPYDIGTIREVSEALDPDKKLFVGGGYTTESKIQEVIGIADVIVVGTELERNPQFSLGVRKVLDENQSSNSS